MRKFLIVSALFLPLVTFAHGGVSKLVGSTLVSLNQTPLSPQVGQDVQFAFTFTDTKFQQFKNLNFKLDVIDTAFNNPAADHLVYTTNVATDVNGNYIFKYIFPTSDYYDVELTFTDPTTDTSQTTGFLVQPIASSGRGGNWLMFLAAGFVGLCLGLIIGRFKIFGRKSGKDGPVDNL
ncbi:MAG TPA: hypothetical protein VFX17_00440 [Patescibacteria group bacterium]|nr:hypothetical protein [Patescibacteria group bacterium]